MFEFALLTKSVALAGAAIAIYWKAQHNTFRRRLQLQKNYRFAKEFLSDLKKGRGTAHPLLYGLGAYSIIGRRIDARAVPVLLQFPDPLSALLSYAQSHRLIDPDGTGKLKYKWLFAEMWWRMTIEVLNFIAYLLFVALALGPILFAPAPMNQAGLAGLIVTLFSLGVFGPLAYFFAGQRMKFKLAAELVRQSEATATPPSSRASRNMRKATTNSRRKVSQPLVHA